MESLQEELEARRWLWELCANAQKELNLSHFQIAYILLEKAHLELSMARMDLERSDT